MTPPHPERIQCLWRNNLQVTSQYDGQSKNLRKEENEQALIN